MGALALVQRFRGARAGVSSVEFAFVFPILLLLLLAGAQVVLYIDASRKVQQIATSISEMLSQAAPATSGDTTASVNATDLNFSYDATLVIFPYVMTDAAARNIPWRQAITVSFAAISFTKLNTTCDGALDQSPCFAATVDWTSTGTSAAAFRPCLTPQLPVGDAAPYSRFTLPRSLYGPGSVIAVDVTYTFNPSFGARLVKPITITRSAFVQPRYATKITFDTSSNDGIASVCPLSS